MDARTGLPVVGMVGGGQLARMTHQAAIALGQSLRVLAASPDDGAALVAADVLVGQHTDLAALRELAAGADVVTFDHEHVPTEHIRALVADGHTVYPEPDALVFAQDKQRMRERLSAAGLPCPRWTALAGDLDAARDEVVKFGAEVGWPVVLKAARGGYDGRGVWFVDGAEQAAATLGELCAAGTAVIAEERVAMRRELAAVVARSPFGQIAAYPVVETVQSGGICVEVLAPAPGLSEQRALAAQKLAIDIAAELGVVGVLAVELFETTEGSLRPEQETEGSVRPEQETEGSVRPEHQYGHLVVNELAMRPHNSAHWTIEGAHTSQFEQHLRAVLDYPLGATGLRAPATVMVNVLGPAGRLNIDERLHHLFADVPEAKVHLYGKQVRPGRKIGHVTVLGADPATVRERARQAAAWLGGGQ